jgi:hypothetical protein
VKDWRRFADHQSIELRYYPDVEEADTFEEDERSAAEFGNALSEELASRVNALRVDDEQPDDEGLAAGGADLQQIMYVVLSAMGAYVTLREVATDIRTVIVKLRSLRDNEDLAVPKDAIMILAWDYVAPPNSHAVAELQFIAPISRVTAGGYGSPKAWLVGFTVDGEPTTVVLNTTGEVLGSMPGIDLQLVPPLSEQWETQD